VAQSSTGKWVSRVAASGGSKAYKKTRPINYYGVVSLIVVLGLLSVIYSRYEYQNPSSASTTPPAIGTNWFVALAADNCGTALPSLNPDPNYPGGYHILSNNVLSVRPLAASEAGDNATLARFVAEFPGLTLDAAKLAIPNPNGTLNPATTFKNGDTCAAGTKYAGQKGVVKYAYWTNFGQSKPTITTDPSTIKLTNYLRVTMAFVPASVTPTPPSQATVNTMYQVAAAASTSTTAITVTSTTLPSLTTTTVATTSSTTTSSTTTTTTAG